MGALHGLPIAFKDLEAAVGFPFTRGSPIFSRRDAARGHAARRAAAARRRDSDRQDQRAGVRHGLAHLQQGVRDDAESMGPEQERRRIERRCRRRRRHRHAAAVPTAATSADRSATPAASTTSSASDRRSGSCRSRRAPLPFVGFGVKGPIARSVEDAAFLLSAIAGSDARDPASYPSDAAAFARPLGRDFRNVRVAWCPDLGGLPLDPRVRAVIERQRRTFEDLGCIVETGVPGPDRRRQDLSRHPRVDVELQLRAARRRPSRSTRSPRRCGKSTRAFGRAGATSPPRDRATRRAAAAGAAVSTRPRVHRLHRESGAAVRRVDRLADGDRRGRHGALHRVDEIHVLDFDDAVSGTVGAGGLH